VFTTVAWAVSAIWIDRDARGGFGRSTVWKVAFQVVGVAFVLAVYSWGIQAIEAVGWLLLLVVISYATLRAATLKRSSQGIYGMFMVPFGEIAKVLGMSPDAAAKASQFRNAARQPVILLKKDGGIYGNQDFASVDRETFNAIDRAREMLTDAIALRATDIHVEPRNSDVHVRVRVDGLLQPLTTFPVGEGRTIASAIMVLSDMDIADKRRSHEGTFSVLSDGHKLDVRVHSSPTQTGEKLSIRLLDPEGGVLRHGLEGI